MFYDTFERICKEKGTSPSAVCVAAGLSKTTSSYWKRSGGIPKRETLEKIAKLLSVPVDTLLEREIEKPLEPIALRATVREWTEILNNMTDENLIKLRDYARLLLLQQHSQAAQEGQESRK